MANTKDEVLKIIIGGDLCPVYRNEPAFIAGTVHKILNELYHAWMDADLRIINLECPLISAPSPINKTGPHFGANEKAVEGLKAMKIDAVGIANNHILDHGREGLMNTIKVSRENALDIVGGGGNLSEAGKPLIYDVKNKRVAFIAMADLEWSIAGRNSAGANPFSMVNFLRTIRNLQDKCDFVVALMHLGKEYYPYPSPELQDICRCMLEEGASVVVCQHSHCIGASEYYNDGYICYGQGNFIFDNSARNVLDSWSSGCLLQVNLQQNRSPETKRLPFRQGEEGIGVRKLDPTSQEVFHERVDFMDKKIKSRDFVEKKWSEFSRKNTHLYFSILRGHSRLLRRINKLTGMSACMYSSEDIAVLENVIRCQSHRELLKEILSELRKQKWS